MRFYYTIHFLCLLIFSIILLRFLKKKNFLSIYLRDTLLHFIIYYVIHPKHSIIIIN